MNGIKNDKGRNFIWFALFNLVKFEKKNKKKKNHLPEAKQSYTLSVNCRFLINLMVTFVLFQEGVFDNCLKYPLEMQKVRKDLFLAWKISESFRVKHNFIKEWH